MRPTDKRLAEVPHSSCIFFFCRTVRGHSSHSFIHFTGGCLMIYDNSDKVDYRLFNLSYLKPSFILKVVILRVTTITILHCHRTGVLGFTEVTTCNLQAPPFEEYMLIGLAIGPLQEGTR